MSVGWVDRGQWIVPLLWWEGVISSTSFQRQIESRFRTPRDRCASTIRHRKIIHHKDEPGRVGGVDFLEYDRVLTRECCGIERENIDIDINTGKELRGDIIGISIELHRV